MLSSSVFGLYAAAAWPTANLAIYKPFILPASATVYEITFVATTSAGNFDLGIYDRDFAAITRKGSTAVSSGLNTFSTADLRLRAGRLYYLALSLSSTSDSVYRRSIASANFTAISGHAQEASALPLPSTGTPATFSALYSPLISLSIR